MERAVSPPEIEEFLADERRVHGDLLRPLQSIGWRFGVAAGLLSLIGLWGLYAWGFQIQTGMGVAGINRPVYWGVYIATFVFYVGISHAGTLISAILRLCHAADPSLVVPRPLPFSH